MAKFIKKHIAWIIVIIALLAWRVACVITLDESEYLEFRLNDDQSSYTLIGIGNCEDTEIIIPETHAGLPVTAIGEAAFEGNASVVSFTIPDSITSIGNRAFYGCQALSKVDLPKRLEKIGDYAFSGCSALSAPKLPDTLNVIGDSAFENCSAVIELNVPDNVSRIGASAFEGCTSLKSLTLPFIGSGENSGSCYLGYIFGANDYEDNGNFVPQSLRSVTITKSSYIGDGAFFGCSSLENI